MRNSEIDRRSQNRIGKAAQRKRAERIGFGAENQNCPRSVLATVLRRIDKVDRLKGPCCA